MPYIPEPDRAPLDPSINDLAAWLLRSPDSMVDGRLNYIITAIVRRSLLRRDVRAGRPRYSDYARVVAALECAKLEVYRTQAGPYEAEARRRNGDVA